MDFTSITEIEKNFQYLRQEYNYTFLEDFKFPLGGRGGGRGPAF